MDQKLTTITISGCRSDIIDHMQIELAKIAMFRKDTPILAKMNDDVIEKMVTLFDRVHILVCDNGNYRMDARFNNSDDSESELFKNGFSIELDNGVYTVRYSVPSIALSLINGHIATKLNAATYGVFVIKHPVDGRNIAVIVKCQRNNTMAIVNVLCNCSNKDNSYICFNYEYKHDNDDIIICTEPFVLNACCSDGSKSPSDHYAEIAEDTAGAFFSYYLSFQTDAKQFCKITSYNEAVRVANRIIGVD